MIPSFFYLTLIILSSCAKKMPEGTERFAVKECYRLEKTEKMLAIDSIISEEYAPIYSVGKHEIPLNRVFENKDYKTFVGLALSSKAENLYQDHLKSAEINVLDKSVEKEKYHLLLENNGNYVYRYIYTESAQKITVVLNFVSIKKELITSLFNNHNSFIDEKINCK